VERITEALTGSAVPLLTGWYPRACTSRELAEGANMEAEADRHPDPIAEAVRWRICEGELVQIIGRARGVNRTEADPVDILVLTDVPLPLPVDATLYAADLAPTPADLMLGAGGIEFENAADAAAAYPDLWANAAAARQAFHRARCVTNPNKKDSIRECHAPPGERPPYLRRIDYQLAGPGRRLEAAWCCPALVPDPAAALIDMLGPLAWCSVADPPVPPAPAAEPPEPTLGLPPEILFPNKPIELPVAGFSPPPAPACASPHQASA
jgi:putative DNA primase/helicase